MSIDEVGLNNSLKSMIKDLVERELELSDVVVNVYHLTNYAAVGVEIKTPETFRRIHIPYSKILYLDLDFIRNKTLECYMDLVAEKYLLTDGYNDEEGEKLCEN